MNRSESKKRNEAIEYVKAYFNDGEFEKDLRTALFTTYTNSDGRGMAKNLEKGKSGLNPPKDKNSTF